MAKNPGAGICVHCNKYCDIRNWDHLIPQSWYPSDSSLEVEKIKFPSCAQCNNEYSKVEDRLITAFAACLDTNSEDSKGIWEKQKRSIASDTGKSFKDKKARSSKNQKFLKKLQFSPYHPTEGVMPGFRYAGNDEPSTYVSVLVSADDLYKMATKFVKGAIYNHSNVFLDEAKYKIQMWHLEKDDEEIKEIFDAYGVVLSAFKSAYIEIASSSEDPAQCLLRVRLWNTYKVYVSVLERTEE